MPTAKVSPKPTDSEWNAVKDVEVTNGTKLRCQSKNFGDWVRVVCVGKNDSGGTPKDVKIKRGNTATDVKAAGADKTMLIFQFRQGTDVEALFEWTDKSVTFKSSWPKGAPKPASFGGFELAPKKP